MKKTTRGYGLVCAVVCLVVTPMCASPAMEEVGTSEEGPTGSESSDGVSTEVNESTAGLTGDSLSTGDAASNSGTGSTSDSEDITTGDGTGGDPVCHAGAVEVCYSGPEITRKVGECWDGARTCSEDGGSWGVCLNETLPTFETCDNMVDENCDGAYACNGDGVWGKGAGDNGEQSVDDVAVDNDGSIVVLGRFSGQVDFGGGHLLTAEGSEDLYVVKFASDGAVEWARRFAYESDNGWEGHLAVDGQGAVLVAGTTSGIVNFGEDLGRVSGGPTHIYVAKLSSSGVHLWSGRFGDDLEAKWLDAISVSAGTEIVISGSFRGELDLGGEALAKKGAQGLYLAKFSADGGHLWSRSFEGSSGIFSTTAFVGVDGTGGILVAGAFEGETDFGAGSLTSYPLGGDIYLTKFSANGEAQWSRHYGYDFSDGVYEFAVDAEGAVVLAGNFAGDSIDFGGGPLIELGVGSSRYLAKISPAGDHVWSRSFDFLNFTDVELDRGGNVVLVGGFAQADFGSGEVVSAGGQDIYAVKYEAVHGDVVWSQKFGDMHEQVGSSAATDALGNVWVAGRFQGTLAVGKQVLWAGPKVGDQDMFVMKLRP